MTQRYCFALDLKDDPDLIAEYEAHHRAVWPEILRSIRESGIEDMEIYRVGNRLFMVMEVSEGFSFEAKAEADEANPRVRAWEDLMWGYQQALPWARPGEKWLRTEKIFGLNQPDTILL
jgi:L-rhamnose mutarotase